MMRFLRSLRRRLLTLAKATRAVVVAAWAFIAANPAATLTTLALAALTAGCAMERPSLGLIVPGAFVLGCQVMDRIIGR